MKKLYMGLIIITMSFPLVGMDSKRRKACKSLSDMTVKSDSGSDHMSESRGRRYNPLRSLSVSVEILERKNGRPSSPRPDEKLITEKKPSPLQVLYPLSPHLVRHHAARQVTKKVPQKSISKEAKETLS